MPGSRGDPIDRNIGKLIRGRRKLADASQEALARAIGVTFQQVQKYENGGNRVSASRLARIARALGAQITDFYPELDDRGAAEGLSAAEQLAALDGGQELARAFLVMGPERRRALLNVAEALCSTQPGEEPGAGYVSGGDWQEAQRVAR